MGKNQKSHRTIYLYDDGDGDDDDDGAEFVTFGMATHSRWRETRVVPVTVDGCLVSFALASSLGNALDVGVYNCFNWLVTR